MDQGDFLILSGAYVSAELVAEFGPIPPAFLPFRNKRLYEHQIEFALALTPSIFITIPSDYQIPESDILILKSFGVKIIRSKSDVNLHDAIKYALMKIKPKKTLHILYGDTIISMPLDQIELDIFACGSTGHHAVWAEYKFIEGGGIAFNERLGCNNDMNEVICGYFCFSNGPLYQDLLMSGDNFLDSLNSYSKTCQLKPVKVKLWLDFGHLHTYFSSRQSDLLTRHFNEMQITKHSVKKKGLPHRKIYAEALWFDAAPISLKPFLPQLYEKTLKQETSYDIEYLFLTSLSELFVFGHLPPAVWGRILLSCFDFIRCMTIIHPNEAEIPNNFHRTFYQDIIVAKTFQRCDQFMHENGIPRFKEWKINGVATPNLVHVIEVMLKIIRPSEPEDIRFWHGDFHFANIMFDFRSQRIKTFDPRGMLSDGTLSVWGDRRYDIAKLTHSVIGLYDFIVAERYQLNSHANNLEISFGDSPCLIDVQESYKFLIADKLDVSLSEILAITSLLFLSMLPLHSDSKVRQTAMLANGLRLAHMAEITE